MGRINMTEEFKNKMTKDEVKELDQLRYEGPIHCINSDEDLLRFLPQLKSHKILGFDTETKPNFVKGEANQNKVSLLQLASEDHAYLIRLQNITLKKEIFKVLGNKRVKKIGLAINDDLKSLRKLQDFTPQNFIDLQGYSDKYGIIDNSLRNITGIVLNKRLSKAQRLSNWENEVLQEGQKIYAATDAWVCIKIYNVLKKIKPSVIVEKEK